MSKASEIAARANWPLLDKPGDQGRPIPFGYDLPPRVDLGQSPGEPGFIVWADGEVVWHLTPRFVLDADGFRCVGLTVASPEGDAGPTINGSLLKRIPMRAITRGGAELLQRELRAAAAAGNEGLEQLADRAQASTPTGPRATSMGFYREVAEIWLEAFRRGAESPTAAVAEAKGASIAQAATWIYRARARRAHPELPPPTRRRRSISTGKEKS